MHDREHWKRESHDYQDPWRRIPWSSRAVLFGGAEESEDSDRSWDRLGLVSLWAQAPSFSGRGRSSRSRADRRRVERRRRCSLQPFPWRPLSAGRSESLSIRHGASAAGSEELPGLGQRSGFHAHPAAQKRGAGRSNQQRSKEHRGIKERSFGVLSSRSSWTTTGTRKQGDDDQNRGERRDVCSCFGCSATGREDNRGDSGLEAGCCVGIGTSYVSIFIFLIPFTRTKGLAEYDAAVERRGYGDHRPSSVAIRTGNPLAEKTAAYFPAFGLLCCKLHEAGASFS